MPPIRPSVLVLVFSVFALPGVAEAQSSRSRGNPPSASQDAPSQEYRSAITEALAEFDAGRYEEARALFLRAHAIEPNARTARGIANCAFEVSDYVSAIVFFEEALASDRRPLDARMRQQAEQLLSRARTFVGRVELVVSPPTATVLVDGRAPTMRDGAILLNQGDHEIRIEAEGLVSEVRHVRVEAAAPVEMEVALAPPPLVVPAGVVTSTEAVALGAPAPPPPPSPTRHRRHPVTVPAAIAYGIGGASLVAATAFAIHAHVLDGEHAAGCLELGTCSEASLDAQDRSALLADIGFGVAAVGVTTGLLLQFLHRSDEPSPASAVAPYVGRDGFGATFHSSF